MKSLWIRCVLMFNITYNFLSSKTNVVPFSLSLNLLYVQIDFVNFHSRSNFHCYLILYDKFFTIIKHIKWNSTHKTPIASFINISSSKNLFNPHLSKHSRTCQLIVHHQFFRPTIPKKEKEIRDRHRFDILARVQEEAR